MQKEIDLAVVRVHERLKQEFGMAYRKAEQHLRPFVASILSQEEYLKIEASLEETARSQVQKALVDVIAEKALSRAQFEIANAASASLARSIGTGRVVG